jgi:hypothetical protein
MQFTNVKGLPDTVVKALVSDEYTYEGDISVTKLASPPQVRVLTKRHHQHLSVDVSEMLWSMLGKAVHYVVETTVFSEQSKDYIHLSMLQEMLNRAMVQYPNVLELHNFIKDEIEALTKNLANKLPSDKYISEKRFFCNIGGYTMSCKPDLLEKKEDGTYILYDYKVMSVWGIIFKNHMKHMAQINYYKAILQAHDIIVTEAKLVCMMRDWKENDRIKNDDYPEVPIQTYDMPLYPTDKVTQAMLKRLIVHFNAEQEADESLPECTPEEKWTKPSVWKAYKQPYTNGDRAVKAFKPTDTKQVIDQWMLQHGSDLILKEIKGENSRCESFCIVKDFCFQRRREASLNRY